MASRIDQMTRDFVYSLAAGLFLGALVATLLLPGVIGILLAVAGGAFVSLGVRGIRMVTRSSRMILTGLALGFMSSLGGVIYAGLRYTLIVNSLAGMVFVVAQAAALMLITDQRLRVWLVGVFPNLFE